MQKAERKRNKAYNVMKSLLYGQILLWAAFEIMAVPMIWKGYAMPTLLPVATVLLVACVIVMIVRYRKKFLKPDRLSTETNDPALLQQSDRWQAFLVMILTALVVVIYILLPFRAEGDAGYMASVTDMWQTGRFFRIDPLSGQEMLYISKKTIAAAFPAWEAWLSSVVRLHPLILCHLVLPVVFVPFSVIAWRELAREVFSKKEGANWVPVILLVLWILAVCIGKKNGLFPIWQGEYAAGLIVFPVFIRQLLKQSGGVCFGKLRYFFLKAIVLLAMLLCSWKAATAGIAVWIGVFLIRLLEGKQYEQT